MSYRRVLPRWSESAPADATAGAGEAAGEAPEIVAVIDTGATSIRMTVAELGAHGEIRVLEEASRGVLLGKDTFTHGRIGAATLDSMLRVLEGFQRILTGYGVRRCRAVATSAVREASNRDSVLDRIRLRTGLEVEVIDGSEENRLTYLAVRSMLAGHPALSAPAALLVEIGGGSADISLLHSGEPAQSGTYPLGAIRMRQSLSSWHGSPEQRARLLRRHIHNVVEDIRREIPLAEAAHFIALGGDMRFAAQRILRESGREEALAPRPGRPPVPLVITRDEFFGLCDRIGVDDIDALAEEHRLSPAEAETLVPALLANRELIAETAAAEIIVLRASLRSGLLLDLSLEEAGRGLEEFRVQVLASAETLGAKYRFDAAHGRQVARLAVKLFDELTAEHGLDSRDRLLLEVAALLHDIGIFVGLRGHHKHSQYLLASAEIFGLSRDDMAVVANVARYHRRSLPMKSHPGYTALDRPTRVVVNKLAAILRLTNALDADHLQKITSLKLVRDDDAWSLEVEGSGDLTMERLAALARADLFVEIFGRRILFRQAAPGA